MTNPAPTEIKTAIIPFGTRDEVKEMQSRLELMLPSILPNASALTPAEALALAQVALAHGLSPFNAEIYFIPRLGVYPGIRGYRKAAHRQTRKEGGQYWLSEPKWSDPVGHGGEVGDLCCIYELRDSMTMGAYLKLRSSIFEMTHLPTDILKLSASQEISLVKEVVENTALKILGQPPITIGVGIVKKYEIDGRIKKAGINPKHIAKIRAERAALRLRFDLDLVFGNNDDAWQEAESIDAQIEDIDEPAHPLVVEEPEPVQKSNRPYDPATLHAKLTERAAKNKGKICTDGTRKVIAAVLGKVFKSDTERYEFTKWAFGEASTKKLSAEQILALQDWLNCFTFESTPEKFVIDEAQSAHSQALIDAGQMTLPEAK